MRRLAPRVSPPTRRAILVVAVCRTALPGEARRRTLLDIGLIAREFADAAAQDRFCAGTLS
jgi:hypothetical protein